MKLTVFFNCLFTGTTTLYVHFLATSKYYHEKNSPNEMSKATEDALIYLKDVFSKKGMEFEFEFECTSVLVLTLRQGPR